MNLYCIIFPNGKKYVGVESNDGQRKQYHSKGHRHTVIGRAISKYGWKNCQFKYLIKGASKETCLHMEKKLIKLWNLQNTHLGYNISSGGEGGHTGIKHNPETIEKMKLSRSKYQLNDEWKRAISQALIGKKHSEARNEAQSLGRCGKEFDVLKDGNVMASYFNQSKCAKDLGLSSKKINQCLHKKARSHKGYLFVFKDFHDL